MQERGHFLMGEWHRDIIYKKSGKFDSDMLKIGFHNPKCTSIDHLHMHMMVGKRKWKAWFQFNFLTYTSINDLNKKINSSGKL